MVEIRHAILLVLCLGSALSYYDVERNADTTVWDMILPHLDIDALETSLKELGDDVYEAYLEEVAEDGGAGEPEATAACPSCRSLVGGLKGLVRRGLTCDMEELIDLAITICVPMANDQGYTGDIICPGLINNFCPDVVYTVNNTGHLSAQETCVFFRKCAPDVHDVKEWKIPQPKKSSAPRVVPKRDYDDYIKVVHVTDIHVDQQYREGAPDYCTLPLCCRDGINGTGSAEYWGNYRCGLPTHTVESFLKQLRDYDPQAIFYTGDSPPHAVWEETQDGQIDDSVFVAELLAEVFPDLPSYTALGNHDSYPVNVYGRDRPDQLTEDLNQRVAESWGPVSRFEEEQYETFYAGGYYSILNRPGLRVVSYNSVYGTTENFYGILPYENGEVDEMFDYVRAELTKARDNGEKVILLGHHPNGGSGRFRFYDEQLYNITNEFGDIILLHYLGHTHSDDIHMTIDRETGEPRNVWLCTGSMVTITNKNPSAKIFYLDPDTFQPVDFDAVYMDFAEVELDDPDEEPKIALMYRASEEYDMEDLSPRSWGELIDRFETDDEVYYRFKYNQNTRFKQPGACEGTCRKNDLCSIRTVTGDDRTACRNS